MKSRSKAGNFCHQLFRKRNRIPGLGFFSGNKELESDAALINFDVSLVFL